ADAEHGKAGPGLLDDGVHHRREAGDGPGAQIVAVGETAAQHHGVDLLEVLVLVPERHGFGAGQSDRALRVPVVEAARESDDADTSGHFAASATASSDSTRTVKSSITVLARKDSARSWMRASAASSTGPSTSSSKRFPWRTSEIPSKPSRGSARCTAWPWGSRISGLSMTSTTTRATGTPGVWC